MQLKQYSPYSSTRLPPMLELCWSQYQLTHSSGVSLVLSFVVIGYYMVNTGFNGFHEQKTEGQVELTIYIFTNRLLGHMQYYLQYLPIVARLLMCYMLCLTTPNLTLASLINWCVCTLPPKPLTFVHFLANM